jgi:cell division protein FtsQ
VNAGSTIRKIFFIALWVAIGGGMFTLLMAAIGKKNRGNCSDYVISLRGEEHSLFMNSQDIVVMLEELMNGPVKGQPIAAFNLRELENQLRRDSWISNAELYFDNKDILHVKVSERVPVARVFTTAGSSFYVDSAGNQMPVSSRRSARVTAFTGFPGRKQLSTKDSILLSELTAVAVHIYRDPFWRAQVSQVDITPDRDFEIIPLVGDHRIKIGDGQQLEAKFRRLSTFYQQVLVKAGMDSYKMIDVRYKGQVVASRNQIDSKVDSARLRKNVEKLMRRADRLETTSVRMTEDLKEDKAKKSDRGNAGKSEAPQDKKPAENKTVEMEKTGEPAQEPEKRVPKAVMPPRKTENNNENDREIINN